MATTPIKSKPLHHFSLPHLKWGHKTHNTNTHNHRFRRRDSPPSTAAVDGGSDIPENLPLKLLKDPNGVSQNQSQAKEKQDKEEVEEGEEVQEDSNSKPWNLRPRRGVTKLGFEVETVSFRDGEMREKVAEIESNHSHVQRSQRLRGGYVDGYGFGSGVGSDRREKKTKLWISLSKEEIEEDVYALTGSRPARRPKKRSKTVQKQVDNVFPGLYLDGLTVDSYRVLDTVK